MAVTDHPTFRQPDHPTIPLWRYMDIAKFAALLQSRSLAFPRADLLGDPFEGSVSKFDHKTRIDTARHMAKQLKTKSGEIPDDWEEKFVQFLTTARKDAVSDHYISCWHMNTHESAAMWDLYGKVGSAVCVKTNYEKLTNALPDSCFIGCVRYVDYTSDQIWTGNMFDAFMHKRISFAHEREARAVFSDFSGFDGDQRLPQDPVKFFDVDLNELIESVLVSPAAPNWLSDVVTRLVSDYGITAQVNQSELGGDPVY